MDEVGEVERVDLRDPVAVAKAASERKEFSECVTDLESALRRAIKAFAAHHAADAPLTREQWAKWFDEETPSDDYIRGYNAGVESVLGSAESFLDEFM